MTREKIDPKKQTQMLLSALHQFAQVKFHDAKTEVIAKEAHVSKGLLFHYYHNKADLYAATVQFAINRIQTVADFQVWTSAHSLHEMIERAAAYKIQLQIQYPDEFKVLLDAYAEMTSAPHDLQVQVKAALTCVTVPTIEQLLTPVLDQLPIKKTVTRQTIMGLMNGIMLQVSQETHNFMLNHPNATMADFQPIINQARQYVLIIENGFLD
ncbi:TetR/AcrR family transcriptional regulator [Levilactobacillus bambusae]|uniref:HTH tetR-type domain-containing protein n=1 Tax=Levilactobacillus bambusae TaxID=2024736 RepID=A0A2V1N0T4_9LACO|nr:TetR/AcrR family transcriptional regulator [Levilactobacillus bambusae]PWG00891.1 hypothetical protein DCM90_01580 [Levilactobacillus bambusae]